MRQILALPCLLLLLPAAHAQILEAYGTFSYTHVCSAQSSGTGFTGTYSSISAPGFGGGVTVYPLRAGPFSLGLDLRGSAAPAAPSGQFGIKAAAKLPLVGFKPYFQASLGILYTNVTSMAGLSNSTVSGYNGTYEFIGGVDHPLLPFLSLRIVEFGFGRQFGIGTVPNFYTFNTGLVARF